MSNFFKRLSVIFKQDDSRGAEKITLVKNNIRANLETLGDLVKSFRDPHNIEFYQSSIESYKLLSKSNNNVENLNDFLKSTKDLIILARKNLDYERKYEKSNDNKNNENYNQQDSRYQEKRNVYGSESVEIERLKGNIKNNMEALSDLIKVMKDKKNVEYHSNALESLKISLKPTKQENKEYFEDLFQSSKNYMRLAKSDIKREKEKDEKKQDFRREKTNFYSQESQKPSAKGQKSQSNADREVRGMSEQDKKDANIKIRDIKDLQTQLKALENDLNKRKEHLNKLSPKKARGVEEKIGIQDFNNQIFEKKEALNKSRSDVLTFIVTKEKRQDIFENLIKQSSNGFERVSADVLVDGLKKSIEIKNDNLTELLSDGIVDLSKNKDETAQLIESLRNAVKKGDKNSAKKFEKKIEESIKPSRSTEYTSSEEGLNKRHK
jgi:hypothetical protein